MWTRARRDKKYSFGISSSCQERTESINLLFCSCQEPLSCRLWVALCLQKEAKEFWDAEWDVILQLSSSGGFGVGIFVQGSSDP